MRRYGGNMGRYSIRPLDESGLGFSKKGKSVWKTLSGWCLDGSNGQVLEFEMLGEQTGVWKDGRKGDRLVSDRGRAKSFFWTDSDRSSTLTRMSMPSTGREKDMPSTAPSSSKVLRGSGLILLRTVQPKENPSLWRLMPPRHRARR